MRQNLVHIIFDSCRFDSFVAAKTPNISRLGEVSRRYAFASWTVPSHAVYLMGASPHTNPRGVFASEVYKKDFYRWSDRLGIPDVSFASFIPYLSMPAFLKEQHYRTNALISMPVLNQTTIMNKHFDTYELMDRHDDFESIVDMMKFDPSTPSYYFVNVGETHYPYSIKGVDAHDFVKGQHSVFSKEVLSYFGDGMAAAGVEAKLAGMPTEQIYDMSKMEALRQKQIHNVEQLDALFEKLYAKLPPNTHVIVTADHGEVFGEDGFFGHGPVFHEKVFEVPFIEGRRP